MAAANPRVANKFRAFFEAARAHFGLAMKRSLAMEKGFRDGTLERAKYDKHLRKVLGKGDRRGEADAEVDLSRLDEGWDGAAFSGRNIGDANKIARVGWSTSRHHRTLFFKRHPQRRRKVWVHHAIEKQLLKRYPGSFHPEEIQSFENLRGIPNAVNREIHLIEIRILWNRFYKLNSNPSREDVLRYVEKIDRKLGSRFNPPI